MTNKEKYQEVFKETFGINVNELENLQYQSIPSWDSVGHMNLIASLEDTFDIMLETDDIVDFNSYKKGIEILKKNGVEF